MPKLKVVHVTWRDSVALHGWDRYDAERGAALIESIGFLVAENDDHLAIATSHDVGPANEPWCQLTIIPAEAIVKKRVVRDA
ncbi:hypothetical protein LCGC14_0745190 [marine sediment metagenome]|uniref:Uncharacterized protein n=1 Tax=marine sediment metagenome TaxID=412755 RepID=A0A0F9SQI7_9ZZZZ